MTGRTVESVVRSCVAAIIIAVTWISSARAQPTLEKFLVPVSVYQPTPGANGSQWTTSLLVRNKSSIPVRLGGVFVDCGGIGSCGGAIDLVSGASYEVLPTLDGGSQASILYVPAGRSADLTFTLRVQDLSRQSQTWGTTVPVVNESQFRPEGVLLLDVPVSASFRNNLRIYEIDGQSPTDVIVRVFAIAPARPNITELPPPDRLLGETVVTLGRGRPDQTPSYAQIANLSEIANVASVSRVCIQVVPRTPGVRIWSFVSITNNETQHVTVITPQ